MTQSTESINTPHAESPATHRVVNIFIGGLLDRSSCIVANYRKIFQSRYPDHTAFYFEYDQHKEIIAAVISARTGCPADVFNVIGHSWGATTAIEAANELAHSGINVNQVITVDPVSRKRVSLTASATKWINVNAAPATSNGWNGDYWALMGGKWDDWPRGKATVHYWAPCHHNEFASLFEYVSLDAHCALDCLINSAQPEN